MPCAALQLSGIRLLYSAYEFREPTSDGSRQPRVTCHYFSGLGFSYAIVDGKYRNWCKWVCRPNTNAFRPMFQPGHSVAMRPICRD